MKKKRILTLILALVLVLVMAVPAQAATKATKKTSKGTLVCTVTKKDGLTIKYTSKTRIKTKVTFKVWSAKNGKDDLKTYKAKTNSKRKYFRLTIPKKKLSNYGKYYIQVWSGGKKLAAVTIKRQHTWKKVTKTVTYKAQYTDAWVIDAAAYDEEVVTQEAYDEEVLLQEAYEEQGELLEDAYDEELEDGSVVHHDVVYETIYHEAEYETVHHDAVIETVHHAAVGHYEPVLKKAAYKKTVVTGYKCSCGKTKHKHAYVPVYETVHHEAATEEVTVVDQAAYDEQVWKDAWDEEVETGEYQYVVHTVCDACGAYLDEICPTEEETVAHMKAHILAGESSCYYTHQFKEPVMKTVHHEAGYETVHHKAVTHKETVETPAYDVTTITGYKCSCGKTK